MKKLNNGLKLGVGIIISIFFMILAFRKVDFYQMMNSIRNANYFLLFVVFCSILFSHWLRALRWRYLLLPIKHIDIYNLFTSLIIGYGANVVLPAHLGEFLRAYIIGKKRSLSTSCVLATIVTERIMDVFSLLILMIFAMVVYPFPDLVKKSGYIIFVIAVCMFLFLVLLKRNTEKTINFVRIILKIFPESISSKIIVILSSFLEGLVGLKKWEHYILIAFLSVSIWACYGFVFFLGFLVFDFHLHWIASLVVLVFVAISIVVPSSPGYIGTYHWLCQMSLSLFGVSSSSALAYALVMHGINSFPFLLIGLLFAWREGVSILKITNREEERNSLMYQNL